MLFFCLERKEKHMRIIKYSIALDNDRKCGLIKEKSSNYPEISRLDSPQKIADMLNIAYKANTRAEEYLWLIAMDVKCNPIGVFEVSHGTVNQSCASPREIFVRLCLCGAACFVIAHCHPSGDTTPSKEDIAFTKQLKSASEIMSISMLDHIIIGQNYYSFKEEKIL